MCSFTGMLKATRINLCRPAEWERSVIKSYRLMIFSIMTSCQ